MKNNRIDLSHSFQSLQPLYFDSLENPVHNPWNHCLHCFCFERFGLRLNSTATKMLQKIGIYCLLDTSTVCAVYLCLYQCHLNTNETVYILHGGERNIVLICISLVLCVLHILYMFTRDFTNVIKLKSIAMQICILLRNFKLKHVQRTCIYTWNPMALVFEFRPTFCANDISLRMNSPETLWM